ncbi:hypothetical protein [Bradyrhizobium sp. sBnM-33]|uniref:hypothetical protein n=1 Tax=Bradyrhizobium sp. sBnM-33 TaxID=2831780 RepID=UPI001BCAF667|nr:hypothetical protein [Bradyrhizobium sp. sBnM-33]WOH53274.1 hypothetical protein RX328_15020 [Bradyrhizobium sp. sBnM-33]
MFKKILAPIRGTQEDAAALDVAFLLANQFGSSVEALYAAPLDAASITVDVIDCKPAGEIALPDGTELQRAALVLFSRRLETATTIVPLDSGLSGRFSALPGTEPDLIAANGRISDLIVITRPSAAESAWPNLSLESAIRETGSPVLLIPRAVSRIGGRTVVAWNGNVEAARAVRFALPLLRKSVQIVVVIVGGQPCTSSGAKLVEYLRCHGVRAEM